MSDEVFWNKIAAYQKWVEDTTPKRNRALFQPPIHNLLWKLGYKSLPAPYQGSFGYVMKVGLAFSVLWHILFFPIIFLLFDFGTNVSREEFSFLITLTFLSAILGFGVPMLLMCNRALKNYQIPDWSSL